MRTHRMLVASALVALVALLSGSLAHADPIVFDNGGPDGGYAEATVFERADDFLFSGSQLVTGAGLELFLSDGAAWDGTVQYAIYSSVPTFVAHGIPQVGWVPSPGTELASGVGQGSLLVATETVPGGSHATLEFDFEHAFTAAAQTTYWLGIHLSGNWDQDGISWRAASGDGDSNHTWWNRPDQGYWATASHPGEFAFHLHGAEAVPRARWHRIDRSCPHGSRPCSQEVHSERLTSRPRACPRACPIVA